MAPLRLREKKGQTPFETEWCDFELLTTDYVFLDSWGLTDRPGGS